MIMGTKNENFLTYLDTEIMKINTKSRYFTIAGVAVFLTHFAYLQISKRFFG